MTIPNSSYHDMHLTMLGSHGAKHHDRAHEPWSRLRAVVLPVVPWALACTVCFGLPHPKASSRAFPRSVVKTTSREVAREVESNGFKLDLESGDLDLDRS
uniref:Uncharacterized protein n=1 Tax=Solanum tuberosum TaxID=4113 RepID=M1DAR6_SOLTU